MLYMYVYTHIYDMFFKVIPITNFTVIFFFFFIKTVLLKLMGIFESK